MVASVLLIAGSVDASGALLRTLWRRQLEVFVGSSAPRHETSLCVNPRRRLGLPSPEAEGYPQAIYEVALQLQVDAIAPADGGTFERLAQHRSSFEHAGLTLVEPPLQPGRADPRPATWEAVSERVSESIQEFCATLRPRRLVGAD